MEQDWITLRSGREVASKPTTEPLDVMDLGIMRAWCFRSESKEGFWTIYEKNNDSLCVDSDGGDESTRTFKCWGEREEMQFDYAPERLFSLSENTRSFMRTQAAGLEVP